MNAWGALALASIGLLSCTKTIEPEVTRVSPKQGPYGTIVTVEGIGLNAIAKTIRFENGVSINFGSNPESFLSWDNTKIVFRVPSPAAGDYRIDAPELSLELGRFEPTPYRPIALSHDEVTPQLDWVALGPDSVVEAVHAGATLELRFLGPEGVEAVQTIDVDAGTAKLVAVGPDTVNGFFFDRRASLVFGSFAATRETLDVVTGAPPSTTEALVAADRDAEGSYAWLSDLENQRLLKWRVTDGVLSETLAVDDPADPFSVERFLGVRDQQAWRVWAVNEYASEVVVHAAHLAPGSESFASPFELGSADDEFWLLSMDGVGLNGELAVDFCGREENLISIEGHCVSVAADPEGVLEDSEDESADERTLRYVFDAGLAQLECSDSVNLLTMPDATDSPVPLFAPCAFRPWPHKLDARGVPSFAMGRSVLTKH